MSDANHSLQSREDVRDQAEDSVRRHEVRAVVADLVVLDHDQSSDGCEERDIVESCMRVCTFLLLLRGVCRLNHEDALNEQEESGGVEEL